MPSVMKMLHEDHAKSRWIIAKLLRSTRRARKTREKGWGELKQDLTIHMRFEEKVFYPTVLRATRDKSRIETAIVEHEEAKALMRSLDRMAKTSQDWASVLEKLESLLEEHFEEEERGIFPEAEKFFADDLDAEMAAQYGTMKDVALSSAA